MRGMERIRRKLASLVAGQEITWPEPMPTHWRPGGGKIFCIGRNKTGTTSLEKAFKDLGYTVADYAPAELLCDEFYFERRFTEFVKFCKGSQVFQDVPFSYPYLYVYLDQVFPGSKFILSVRDDAEQWYRSITRFHGKRFGTDGAPPTAEELKNATYRKLGFAYNTVKVHGTTDEDPYHKQTMIDHYNAHNRAIEVYFRYRPDDLLVVNLAKDEDYKRFIQFLGVSCTRTEFPRENVT
jgi:hypothetical protein